MTELNTKSLLWLGAGDIASRCEPMLTAMGITSTFVTRSLRQRAAHKNYRAADISSAPEMQELADLRPDYCVLSFSPKGRREEDYELAYLQSLSNVLFAFSRLEHRPSLLVFVSSTSVYPQHQGELVTEESATASDSVSSSTMLACEALLAKQCFPTCALRFSGVYGPGRHHLLRQVQNGNTGGVHWTNRIHAEDCAAIIAFLIERAASGVTIPNRLLASDDQPIKSADIKTWLADKLGVVNQMKQEPVQAKSARVKGLGKRCDNSLLKSLGFKFNFPSYEEGFPEIIEEFKTLDLNS